MSMAPLTLQLAGRLEASVDGRGSPLVSSLFPGRGSREVADELLSGIEESVATVDEVVFVALGVGLVVGVVLTDGREVVLKVHRWNVEEERLSAIQRVQNVLRSSGLPAPRPILGPRPFGKGLATVEELLAGDRVDGHDPDSRDHMAAGLAALVEATAAMATPPELGSHHLRADPAGQLWGEPHDLRFDFEASASGAEWIDDLAIRAKRVLSDVALPDVVAHLDWRVENVAFADGRLVAIYDWDSVALAPEAVAVGQASAQFSTDWSIGFESLPSLDEMRSFVRSYESHRGRRFEAAEWEVLEAANLLLCASGARCVHSLYPARSSGVEEREISWISLLRQRADEAL